MTPNANLPTPSTALNVRTNTTLNLVLRTLGSTMPEVPNTWTYDDLVEHAIRVAPREAKVQLAIEILNAESESILAQQMLEANNAMADANRVMARWNKLAVSIAVISAIVSAVSAFAAWKAASIQPEIGYEFELPAIKTTYLRGTPILKSRAKLVLPSSAGEMHD